MDVSTEAAIILAIFIITTAFILLVSRYSKGQLQARDDELKKAASLRGWTFDTKTAGGYRIYTFTGATDGVSWVAESAKSVINPNRSCRSGFER